MVEALARLRQSPVLARAVPFAVFAVLTLGQGRFGDTSQFWIYALKTLVGGWLLWMVRPSVAEMRWNLSWEAVAIGVAVSAAWVGLEPFYPKLTVNAVSFNPH